MLTTTTVIVQETLGGRGYIYGRGGHDGFMHVYFLIPKLIQFYTINIYSSLHVNHISIKWF